MCGGQYIYFKSQGNAPLDEAWCIMCIHGIPPPPQVAGEDEGVREKAIEYVSTSLISMRHILFIPHPENEKHLLSHVKEVSCDGLSLPIHYSAACQVVTHVAGFHTEGGLELSPPQPQFPPPRKLENITSSQSDAMVVPHKLPPPPPTPTKSCMKPC